MKVWEHYIVRAITIKGQNTFAPMLYFAQVSRDRRSKHTWSDYEWWKVQMWVTKLRAVHSIHSQWKSQWMLSTYMWCMCNNNLDIRTAEEHLQRDPFNQNSDQSDREKSSTSNGGPVFSKLFWLDRTDPLSFGPKFLGILVKWIAPLMSGPLENQ